MASTFYSQISANRRNSLFLAGGVIVILGILGYAIGYAIIGTPAGGVFTTGLALAVGVLTGVGTYFGGDKLVLAASGAKPVDETSQPQLMNIVQEIAARGEPADAQGLHHRRHRPERLRDRPGPAARVDRGHDRACSRSSTARSSRGSSPTSSRTSATSISGSRCSSGSWSGRSRSWPTSSCASRSGAAAGGRTTRQWRQRRPGDHHDRGHRPGHPGPARQPVHPARGQPPARVPGRRLGDRADPQPVRAGAGAGPDRSDQEVLEVANRGTQHMYFTNPIKKFEARSSGLMSTHPPILDRINRLRQLTGDPPLPTSDAASLAGLE